MNGYDLMMKPLEKHALNTLRKNFITLAEDDVLEIGAGTGVNLSYYNQVRLTVTDSEISKILQERLQTFQMPYQVVKNSVEKLEFEDEMFDTVVSTLVFCTANVKEGLKEVFRVLKPGGKFIFIEHVLPKENPSRTLFRILTPLWARLSSGCHLNRDFLEDIKTTHFIIEDFQYEMGTKFIAGIVRRPND